MAKHEIRERLEYQKELEDNVYKSYQAAARRLLIKHNAQDLLPMLGLEEEI